jgi:hypothetical protein
MRPTVVLGAFVRLPAALPFRAIRSGNGHPEAGGTLHDPATIRQRNYLIKSCGIF